MENRVSDHEIKYEYGLEEEYLINKYSEKVKFAKYQVSSQLKSAIARVNDQKFEVKLFTGILITIIIAYHFSASIDKENIMLAIIGSVLNYFCSIIYIIGWPICVYKILKSAIIFSTSKESTIGNWAVEKFSLPSFLSEIQTCQIYIQKYNLILEDFELWRGNLTDGISVDKNVIENRMKDVDLNPKISVVFHNYGKLKRFSTIVSVVISIIVYIFLFLK